MNYTRALCHYRAITTFNIICSISSTAHIRLKTNYNIKIRLILIQETGALSIDQDFPL